MTILRIGWPHVFTLTASLAFFLFRFFQPQAEASLTKAALVNVRHPATEQKTARVESLTLDVARSLGVGKILSVLRGRDGKTLELEWESDPKTALRFIDELQRQGIAGNCEQLRLSPSRNRIVFSFSTGRTTQRGEALPITLPAHVFLHSKTPVSLAAATPRIKEKKNDPARVAQLLATQEAERLESKRRELESQLRVTGVVNNGRETLAFMTLEGSKNLIARVGDTVSDARIVAIDSIKNEVRLNFGGTLDVFIKLQPQQGS
jgi:hypothetical protein